MLSFDEIASFEQLYRKYTELGADFTDPDFPPQPEIALSNRWGISERAHSWNDVRFAKASEIFPKDELRVFSEGIIPNDIRQGDLGDCYLLSSLAVLAEHPNMIRRLFLTEETNTSGIYCIWINDNGEWRPIIVDDYLPTRSHRGKLAPVFSQSNGAELWVNLLEKAYAKVYGSYENIEGGFPEEALRDLTGAPYELLWKEQDPSKVWRFISEAVNKKALLAGCTPGSGNREESLPNGLLSSHAYSIIRAVEVQSARGTEYLVQIRNPWGNFEWNGEWGDESPLWTDNIRREIGHVKSDDGLFWMKIQDYVANFEATCVVRFSPDFNYYSVNLSHNYESHTVLRVKIRETSDVTFSINQRDARYFTTTHPDYTYSCGRALIARVDQRGGLEYVTGAHGQERNLQATAKLQPGVYIVVLEVHWNQSYHKKFNFSVYSENSAEIEGVENADLMLVHNNIIKSIINNCPPDNEQIDNYGKLGEPQVTRQVGYIHGLIYYYYQNKSSNKTQIAEAVEVQGKNLRICRPYTNDSKFELTLAPGGEELVVYKIISNSWSWKTIYSFVAEEARGDNFPAARKANKYIYIDNEADHYTLQVNKNYNKYIKKNVNLGDQKRYTGAVDQFANGLINRSALNGHVVDENPNSQAFSSSATGVAPFDGLLFNLLSKGEPFVDEDFPASSQTLYSSPERQHQWSELEYRSLSSLVPQNKFQIFGENIEPTHIQEGLLANSYFLSSLAVLVESPQLIKRLFLKDKPNEASLYAVWLCVNGEWKPIILDDLVPTKVVQGQAVPAFSHSNQGDAWVALLEKAYAKVNGSYEAIETGWPEEALQDLTGAPYEVLFKEQDSEKVWRTISEAKKSKFLIACCTSLEPENNQQQNPNGENLARGRAFAILDAREVTSIRGKERIVRIRNPWSNFEWNGDWGVHSNLWTPQLEKELHHTDSNDNSFWMSINDYTDKFEATTIVKYRSDYYYTSVKLSHGPTEDSNSSLIRVRVSQRSEVTISLNQKDSRIFSASDKAGTYHYSCGRILIGRIEKGGLMFVAGAHGQERNLHVKAVLEPGEYIVSVDVHWTQNIDREFNVSFYSASDLDLEGIKGVDALRVQKNIIRSMILDSPPDDQQEDDYAQVQEPKAKRIMGYAHGVLYYYYVNRSTSNMKIAETAHITGKNLRICEPFQDDEKFEVEVLPNDEILVMYKIISSSFSWKTKYSFAANKVKEYDQIQYQPHGVNYVYEDNSSNKYELDVNNDYNYFLREQRLVQPNHLPNEPQVIKQESNTKPIPQHIETELITANVSSHKPSVPLDNGVTMANNNNNNPPFVIGGQKPPKVYPNIDMKYGQSNSKKIKYINYDGFNKALKITCSNPHILNIKTPLLNVDGYNSEYMRLRFVAPKQPGSYVVNIEIRANGETLPEEILQFTVNSI